MIEIIVATDMKFHFHHVDNLEKFIEQEVDWNDMK